MIDGKTVGLVMSSYITNEEIYNIFKKSVISLIHSSTIIDKIYIIDDCSPHQIVFKFYRSLEKRIETIRNYSNTGIASVKNQSLLLLQDFDIMILSDNDNIFHTNWDIFYCENFIKSNIHNVNCHNTFSTTNDYIKTIDMNNVLVDTFERFYGNLIIIDKYIFDYVGGFPLLPEAYGQEHHQIQSRINRFLNRDNYFYDFQGSKKYIKNIRQDDSFTDRKEKTRMSIANAKEADKIFESGVVYLPIKTKL